MWGRNLCSYNSAFRPDKWSSMWHSGSIQVWYDYHGNYFELTSPNYLSPHIMDNFPQISTSISHYRMIPLKQKPLKLSRKLLSFLYWSTYRILLMWRVISKVGRCKFAVDLIFTVVFNPLQIWIYIKNILFFARSLAATTSQANTRNATFKIVHSALLHRESSAIWILDIIQFSIHSLNVHNSVCE